MVAATRLLFLMVMAVTLGSSFVPGWSQQTYESVSNTTVGSGQSCPGGGSRTLSVPDSVIIADLDFDFRVAHTWRTDINLWLISPDGTRVDLLTGGYTTGWDNYNVRFDDEASVQVDTSTHRGNDSLTAAPESVRSEGGVLSAFDGENAQGTWTIGYCDVYSPADNGTVQRIALIISPEPATLEATKDIAIWDSNAASAFALPDGDVIYSLNVRNTGTGVTDVDSMFLVDALPAEVVFYNDDMDDALSPQTDPVQFADSGSGLSWDYSRDVGFVTGATPPTTFADCTYSPVPGYDPAVDFVCFNPKGSMTIGSPAPEFTISFRARIQ